MSFGWLDPAKPREIRSCFRFEYFCGTMTDSNSPILRFLLSKRILHGFLEENRTQPPHHISICRRAINLSLALIRSRGQSPPLYIFPTALMQFVELAYHQVG